jgi:hypothetical protein
VIKITFELAGFPEQQAAIDTLKEMVEEHADKRKSFLKYVTAWKIEKTDSVNLAEAAYGVKK